MVDVDQFYLGTDTKMRFASQTKRRRDKPGKRRIDVLEEDLRNL